MGNYWHGDYWGKLYWQGDYYPLTRKRYKEVVIPEEARPPVVKEYRSDIMMDLSMEGKSIFMSKKVIPEIELISYYTFIPRIDNDYLLGIDEDLWILNQ